MGAIFGLFIVITLAFYFKYRPLRNAAPVVLPGRNVLTTSIGTGKIDEQVLKTLSWTDLGPTAESAGSSQGMREKIIAVTSGTQNHPTLYLRALLFMSQSDLSSALSTFLQIPPSEIPSIYLYAPYRLFNEQRPSQPNPFADSIRKAAERQELPLLMQARIHVNDGRFPEALKAYLKTDPAEWSDIDMRALGGLRIQAGTANDAAVILQAALRGGRLPGNLRTQAVEVLKAPRDQTAMEDLKDKFIAQLKTNENLRRSAITGAVQQLTARQQFASRKYKELQAEYAARIPSDLPDETVLMLTLSSARIQDMPSFQRWSQELKRRYPTPDIEQWLSQLTISNSTPSRAP